MSRPAATFVLMLPLLLSVVAPLGAEEQPPRGGPAGASPITGWGELPVLKIEMPDGTCYVRLYGQVDGPVRLPLPEESGIEALQIATEVGPGERVGVTFSAVESELLILPVRAYELSDRRGEVIHLSDLGAYGLTDWSMSLAAAPQSSPECCLCGKLGCCPKPGRCLTCGDCGDCCLVK